MIDTGRRGITALLRRTYARYIGASAAALGADFALFLTNLAAGLPPAPAAALGYGGGIAVHWWLSSRAVFVGALAMPGADRRRQQLLFLVSALVGLAITTAVVGLAGALGVDPRLAKLLSVAIAFQATWLMRRRLVFA